MSVSTYHTGRTQLIREFLARHANEAFTAREVRDAVEPGGSVDVVSASLSTMAGSGKITRLGAGKGNVHFCWPMGAPKPEKRRERTGPVTRAQVVRKAAEPIREQRARAAVTKAPSTSAPKRTPAPRRVATNFPAPLATVDQAFDPRRAASTRIAADLAEFQRRGGRIEQLGVTKLFHHPDNCEG